MVSDRRSSNPQLKSIISNNNAIEHSIEESIKWFNQVEQAWDKSVQDGKIYACNEQCGIRE